MRLASVLGGKYVALIPGRSPQTIREGGGVPLSQEVRSVDIDDALQTFKPSTRRSIRATASIGFSPALSTGSFLPAPLF